MTITFSHKRKQVLLVSTISSFLSTLVVCLCFFYLDPIQNDTIVTSRCMHYIFCRGREFKLYDEECPNCDEKRKEGNEEMHWPLDEKWMFKPVFNILNSLSTKM